MFCLTVKNCIFQDLFALHVNLLIASYVLIIQQLFEMVAFNYLISQLSTEIVIDNIINYLYIVL